MTLSNDTKIKVCNAASLLNVHAEKCDYCFVYLKTGDGDLCDGGKQIIFENLYCADTETIVETRIRKERPLR